MSAATGIAYTFAPPPGRLPPPANSYAPPAIRHPLLSTTTIHASIKTSSPNKQHRNSLFYSPWESLHDQSVNHYSDHCTCTADGIIDIYCSAKEKQKSIKGQSSKSVPVIASANDLLESKIYSRMDLYSLKEENSSQKQIEFKSKSSDSLYKPNNDSLSYRLKSCKSSTTLNGNPYKSEPIIGRGNALRDTASATVNERFLRFFKKSSTDPFNSIASRKSILECEVSAYDLVKQNLKSSSLEDDIDDNLSDNAIENENNMANVGNALESNRKSIKSKSSLIHSNSNSFKSGSQSDTGINSSHSSANSIRIAGHGMSLTSQMPINPKSKPNNSANKSINDITKIYSTYEETALSSSTCSWSASSGISDESIAVPEPDYDTDENDFEQIYSDTENKLSNFQHLKVSYSPPLTTKRINGSKNNTIYEKLLAKNIPSNNEIYSKLNYLRNDNIYVSKSEVQSNYIEYDNCVNSESDHYNGLPYSSSVSGTIQSFPPPPPPPPPPCLPLPPPPPLPPTTYKSALKSSSMTSNVTSYQCELKDKLNSGVKSILKKTLIINDHFSMQRNLTECEKDIILEKTPSETCDYLKAYKEFKESRLRGGRHRKHVHFKSHCDDSLIIDHIRETIIEVDEIDEPIYDDVRLPSLPNCDNSNCETSPTNGQNSINDNNCKSEDLNSSYQSGSSDITECASNHNGFDKKEETMEFSEFDPGMSSL